MFASWESRDNGLMLHVHVFRTHEYPLNGQWLTNVNWLTARSKYITQYSVIHACLSQHPIAIPMRYQHKNETDARRGLQYNAPSLHSARTGNSGPGIGPYKSSTDFPAKYSFNRSNG